MNAKALSAHIARKGSYLCVGLDTDLDRVPEHLHRLEDPIFAFNKAIIDATHAHCVAYKPNIAFYEAYGAKGWASLERTMAYLNEHHPDHFTIADAKRGDIGNTATRYAVAFFEKMGFDSITVAPYMGRDSVEPFTAFENTHTVLLALTSNAGGLDFQMTEEGGEKLFEKVIRTSQTYAGAERLMYVVGATRAEQIGRVRELVPNSFLLIPGVGAQGGDLHAVSAAGLTPEGGLLVNSSREILYASGGAHFAEVAGERAARWHALMREELARVTAGDR